MRKHAFFYLLLFTLLIPAAYGQPESLQTYSDSFIRFQYPADWAKCPCDPAENTTAVGNTEEALHAQGEAFAGEMVQVAIIKSYQRQTGITESLTAVDIAEGMKTRGTANYGEIQKLPSGVVRMDFTAETFGVAIEGIVLVVELGNGDATVLNAVSPLGYFAPFETAVVGIAETLVLEEAAPQTVTFQPPAEWVVQEVDSNFVVMAANQDMADRLYPEASVLKKGDVLLTLYKSLDGFLGNVMDVSASPETFFPDLPFFLGYEDVTFGQVEQTGRFARVTGLSTSTEITLVFVDLGNGDKSLLILTTPAGAASKSEALLMQTAESISLGTSESQAVSSEALALDNPFSMIDGSFSLNYPATWDAQEYEGAVIMVSDPAIYS
ncbi:MAG: hypothetical protein K8I82_20345, partial [Anaerolineae bacterium]|nr:hypothetical protein [Anaerolineae bacterium]